jgi:hypothetical protein
VSTSHVLHTRHESVAGEYVAALVSEALIAVLRLGTWLLRFVVGPGFVAPVERPESGVDDRYVTELHDAGAQLVEDREFGLYSGVDLIADATTGSFASIDYAEAWPTGYLADAADLAFAAGTRVTA